MWFAVMTQQRAARVAVCVIRTTMCMAQVYKGWTKDHLETKKKDR